MLKSKAIKGKQLIKILVKLGYEIDHVKGSHHIMRRKDSRKVTVPVHGSQEIPKGTLKAILKDLEISEKDL